MNNNNLEQLVIELFQHIEFIGGDWCIETAASGILTQGYEPVTPELSQVLDALESSLQDGPSVEDDEVSY
jgi:hypothetical protein